jgi:hypothetical protein
VKNSLDYFSSQNFIKKLNFVFFIISEQQPDVDMRPRTLGFKKRLTESICSVKKVKLEFKKVRAGHIHYRNHHAALKKYCFSPEGLFLIYLNL